MTLKAFSLLLDEVPSGFSNMLSSLDNYLSTPVDIVVIGKLLSEEVDDILKSVSAKFLSHRTISFLDSVEPDLEAFRLIPILEGKKMVNGKPTVYICENFTCKTPIAKIEDLEKTLEKL